MSALPLLVLGVALADNASHAVALDHLAMLADRLDAGSDFHKNLFNFCLTGTARFLDRL
jgi:hypothetical protein